MARHEPAKKSESPTTMVRNRSLPYIVAGLLVLVLLVFGRTVSFDFVSWDDPLHISANPHLNPITPESLTRFWTKPYEGLYYPLSYMFFAAEAALARTPDTLPTDGDFRPAVFHAGSVLLHMAAVLLVFIVLRRLFHDDLAAGVGAALFAVHPLQVESVAWISETRGILSTTFGLLALWQYLASADEPARHRRTHYLVATVALVAALLSKPSAVSVPLIAAILDALILKRSLRTIALWITPWLGIAAALALATTIVQPTETLKFVPPWLSRPWIAGDALTFYLGKLFWPVDPAIHYDHAPVDLFASAWNRVAWMVSAVVALGAWRVRKRWPSIPIALLISLVALLPVLGLLPFHFQRFSTVADRYAYLAMLGPALAIAALCVGRPRVLRVAAVVVVVFAGWSFLATAMWRDDIALYSQSLKVNPKSHPANHNLAKAYVARGRTQEAEHFYNAAIEADPVDVESHLGLGTLLVRQGRVVEATKAFRRAVAVDPTNARAHNNLATVVSRRSPAQALPHHKTALELDPDFAEAHNNFGNSLARLGRFPAAIEQYRAALRLRPEYPEAQRNLATAEQLLKTPTATPSGTP